MPRHTILAVFLLCGLSATAAAADEKPAAAQSPQSTAIQPEAVDLGRPVEFSRDVLPILENNCMACHNLAITEGKLNLEDIEGLRKGGRRGPALVANKPDESLLYQMASRAKKPAMPPLPNDVSAEALTPRELGILRKWIEEGAEAGATTNTMKLNWSALPRELNAIRSVSLAESARLVTVGFGNQIGLFDADTGVALQRLDDPALRRLRDDQDQPIYPDGAAHRDFVNALASTDDGRYIASGGFRAIKLWERQGQGPRSTWGLPTEAVGVAASADGKWVAIALADHSITLWNAQTGEPGPVLKGHTAAITGLAFTPSLTRRLQLDTELEVAQTAADTSRFAAERATQELERFQARAASGAAQAEKLEALKQAAADATAKLAEAEQALQTVRQNLERFDSQSRSNSRLVSVSTDATLKSWDFTGIGVQTWNLPGPMTALAVHPDGLLVATAHEDRIIRLWDLSQPPEAEVKPLREIKGHSQTIGSLSFVPPTAAQLVSGSDDGSVRIWNVSNGSQVRSLALGGPVTDLAVSSDGKLIAASGKNKLARIWTANDGKQRAELKGSVAQTQQVQFLTDESAVAKKRVALADARVKEADKLLKERQESKTKAEEQLTKSQTAEQEAVKKAAETAKAAEAATAELAKKPDDAGLKKKKADADKAATDAKTAETTAKEATASAKRNLELSIKTLKTAEEQLQTANAEKAEAEKEQKDADAKLAAAKQAEQAAQQVVAEIEFTPDGRSLLTRLESGELQQWSAANGLGITTLEAMPAGRWTTCIGSHHLVSVDAKNQVTISSLTPSWELVATLGPDPQRPLSISDSQITDRVVSLAFSADGKLLASGGGDPSRSGELMLWDVEKRELLREIKDAHSDTVYGVEFSRDGEFILSGAADKFVKLFRVSDGQHIRSFEGHTNHVMDVAWMADGSRIVSAGADNAIKVWNVATGEQTRTITNYAKQVTSIQFLGVGEDIVSCGGDKTVRLHRTSNGQNIRTYSGCTDYMYAVAGTRDQSLVLAGGEDGILRIWNGKTGQSIATIDTAAVR